jgi:signal transduction histidine kinase/CheY-like chemotaxis protein
MSPLATPRLWRLTPGIALASVIALLVAGVLMARFIDRSTTRQQISELSAQARVLASTVTAALAFNDQKAAQEYVNAIRANPEVEAAGVYDLKGNLFASYPAKGVNLPAHVVPAPPTVAHDRLEIAVPVVQRGTALGTVYLRSFTEPMARRVQRYGLIALLVTMVSVVVAVLAVTQRALSRAHAELAEHAAELATVNHDLETQIGQREKAEEALRQAQKMEAIGQLTGGVAHDFNNLLQVILGNLERLAPRLRGTGADDELRRLIDAASRAAARAATLTQRLLAFSRRQPLMPTSLDVNRLVVGMSELISRTLGEAIRTETLLSGNVWRVSADENQLESALLNLAVNARDAMPSGGRLTVETRNVTLDEAYAGSQDGVQPGDYVQIAVTDTGTGMTKDVVERAFDPFFTTKGIGQGTGLGLSQVYGFVRQSGGHVRIYSEPGHGTTVKLYLPRQPAMLARESTAMPAPVPRGVSTETILVVEDEPDVRVFARDTLRGLGYGVREAGDGKAALDIIEHEPDVRLVLTDIGLPGGLDGRALADEVRRRRPELKVLFTTGYAHDATMRNVRPGTAVELLSKPFNAAELARMVRTALDP